jgi:hypothetical protein
MSLSDPDRLWSAIVHMECHLSRALEAVII